MLSFKKIEISYLDFMKKIESEYNISPLESKDDKTLLNRFCNEHLEPLHQSYPDVYTFFDLSNKNYLLTFDKDVKSNMVYEISYKKNERLLHTPAVVFVINEMVKLGEKPRMAIYDAYGIDDVDCEPLDDQEIRIWCQRQWHKNHKEMPDNNYLDMPCSSFTSIAQAQDYIDALNAKDYKLEPYETARPNYIVTY